MRNEENICRYCTRQRAITTLSLNACWNQMWQELHYLLTNCIELALYNLTLTKTETRSKSCKYYIPKHLTALYFRILIWIFCAQFICFAFDILLQSICFRMFCSKHSITFENTYLLSCWFHCVDILCFKFRFCESFTVTNVVTRILLKHCLTLELLSIALHYIYTCIMCVLG